MTFPTLEEVETADHIQLARWSRFLSFATTVDQLHIIKRITERFKAMGGVTTEISKLIGTKE